MSASPAPASLHLPPRSLRAPKRQAPRDAVLEAPAAELEVDAYLLCVRVRAVGGNTADAMEQCIAKLVRSYQEKLRGERLTATTIVPPAPSSIDAALVDECEQHPIDCTDPCCVSEEDDSDARSYCADEGHQVLTSGAAYYGTAGALGGW